LTAICTNRDLYLLLEKLRKEIKSMRKSKKTKHNSYEDKKPATLLKNKRKSHLLSNETKQVIQKTGSPKLKRTKCAASVEYPKKKIVKTKRKSPKPIAKKKTKNSLGSSVGPPEEASLQPHQIGVVLPLGKQRS
jgi:hypothetical protein